MAIRKAPQHLSLPAQRLYRTVLKAFDLQEHEIALLTMACECLDRATQARQRLAEDGITVPDRNGKPVAHPCVAMERDAKLVFAKCLKELGLSKAVAVAQKAEYDALTGY